LSAERAVATSPQLPASELTQRQYLARWEATAACTAAVPSLWETGEGTEREQATGYQLGHIEDAYKK